MTDFETDAQDLPQPLALLIAHARRADRDWHRLCWTIDERMARIVLGKREGSVAAIRLAWWEEALTAQTPPVKGEPMLERWHALQPGTEAKALVGAVAGAWRMLLDPAPMTEADWQGFGQGRGALFALIASGGDTEALTQAGALWALWDVARRDTDRQRGEGAFAAALALGDMGGPKRVGPRPLHLLTAMAMDDVRARALPDAAFTPRQYLRLLGRSLLG